MYYHNMRVKLSDTDRINLFNSLERKGFNSVRIAQITGVCARTICDWKRGKYTIPSDHFNKIVVLSGVNSNELNIEKLDDWWNNKESGKKGGLLRVHKYGAPGNYESRRLGGINSYKKRKNKKDQIYTPKIIKKPVLSKSFAEYVGVLIGDGGLTKYQVVVSMNSVDDYEYALFVAELVKDLFDITPTLSKRKNIKCLNVVVSSTELVKFLELNGVLQGNKIKQGLDIPSWILGNKKYSIACLRGIFDTDGCIFQESHKIKGRIYSYARWSLVSASPYLRESVYRILIDLEFFPKIRNNRSVNLENLIDISTYFKVVGTSNPKHLSRWIKFGGVG